MIFQFQYSQFITSSDQFKFHKSTIKKLLQSCHNNQRLIYNMFKYKTLSDQLKQIITKNRQLKHVLYNNRDSKKGINNSDPQKQKSIAVAYSNLSLIINNLGKFEDTLMKFHQLLKKNQSQNNDDKITNKYLFFVLIAEYLNTGTIKGGGKLKRLIINNQNIIPKLCSLQNKINKKTVYIRLRKPILQYQQTSKQFSQYQQFQSTLSANSQNSKELSLIPEIYAINSQKYSQLIASHRQIILNSPYVVIQSYSSALPPALLFKGLLNDQNSKKKFDVIDACAAPGNKTLQLSQYVAKLNSNNIVYAFQKDNNRYQLLLKNMKKYQACNVRPIHSNFLQTNPDSPEFKKVKLIMLDPSCSGSGMLTNFTRDSKVSTNSQQQFGQFVDKKYQNLNQDEQKRVLKLKQFQLEVLAHAVKFNPQRISYSTCSIYKQQDQIVVQQFLKTYGHLYRIKKVINFDSLQANQASGQYKIINKGIGSHFKNCVRVDPRAKETDGFFVTIFTRK